MLFWPFMLNLNLLLSMKAPLLDNRLALQIYFTSAKPLSQPMPSLLCPYCLDFWTFVSRHQTILYTKAMDPSCNFINGSNTYTKAEQFRVILAELRQPSTYLDASFLQKLAESLDLRPCLSSQEVSAIAVVFCLAAHRSSLPKVEADPLESISVQKSQDLHKLVQPYLFEKCLKLGAGNSAEWAGKIWKRLVQYSCYRNYLDLALLFYFLSPSFPKLGQELQKLVTLLLHSSSKIKAFARESLQPILQLIDFFIKDFKNKNMCGGVKLKLKILKILFLSKLSSPNEAEAALMNSTLKQFMEVGIQQLIQLIKLSEQPGAIKQEQIIWEKLFYTVLTYYHRHPLFQLVAKHFLMEMLNFKIDMQAVKLMIKQLEITHEVDPAQKWKQIFGLMNFALSVYPSTKEVALFKSNSSYLKIYLNERPSFSLELTVKCIPKCYEEQRFLFMVKGKSKKEQLWVTSCSENEQQIRLILLKVYSKNIVEKFDKIVTWKQYHQNTFLIEFTTKEIRINVNRVPENSIEIRRFIEHVECVVVGDEDNTLGTSVTQFISMQGYTEHNKQKVSEKCFKIDIGSKNFESRQVTKRVLDSFIDIIKAAGDLDIFLLIISHAFKKMKTDPRVIEMVRHSLSLMQHFVQAKRVKNVKLSARQRQLRSNAILCLCWQGSRESRNALAVLELLRVLRFRGSHNFQDELQILCNFVFWKQFEWQYQRLIILKIKQIFMQARVFQLYWKKLHEYCKRILLEAVIFYREEDTLNCPQQKSQVLKIHHEFIELVEQQFQFQVEGLKQVQLIESSLEFLLRLLSLTLSKKYGSSAYSSAASKTIITYDIIFSVQLSLLLRRLCKKLRSWNSKQDLLLKLIAYGLQLCQIYKEQEPEIEDRKYRFYEKDRGFVQTNQNIIKENIFFALEHLVSLKEGMLAKMIEQEEPGVSEIACVAWENQFFQPMLKGKDEYQCRFETNSEALKKLCAVKDRLPLKYLSIQQNKVLLRVYLRASQMFPELNFKMQSHFWNILGIRSALQVVKLQLVQNTEHSTQSAVSSSKIPSSKLIFDVQLFQRKILSLLAGCDSLLSHQALTILKVFQFLYKQDHTKQFALVYYHFSIKNLIENVAEVKKSTQSKLLSEQNETKSSQIFQQESQCSVVMTRFEFIKCVQFYYEQLKINDIMMIKGLEKGEECNCHYENYKINLQEIIRILGKIQPNMISKLKTYYFFIKEHLLKLSRYYLEAVGMVPIFHDIPWHPRKNSRNLQLPKVGITEQAQAMYHQFVKQRKLALVKVEQVWSKVEERNKYFWSIFLGNQMEYTLHEATGPLNEKYLLRKSTKKAKFQLPRMIRTSMVGSASVISEKLEFNEETESASSIFDDARQYSKDPRSCLSSQKDNQLPKERKGLSFVVLFITASKIYQGTLTVAEKRLAFKEAEGIDEELYKKICVSQTERRSLEECLGQNLSFEQELSSKCVAITKRYLFHDLALQVQTKSRSYLFTFAKKGHREAILVGLEKHKVITVSRAKIAEQAKRAQQMWQQGEISNFKYLMRLNNLAGRSLNDLSQYYVFPWSVVNYSAAELDPAFFGNRDNFRDLSLPAGKLSKSKWDNIKKNFERTKRDQIPGIKPFLYGSFYSNPAIVSNFLIRVHPFASQHFELQSNQFDLPDRLFYSVEDSFKSLTACSSDFKELIPEFYYFPEFLKNRNKYNLGSRQNKDIVNNVSLPRWAHDEYEYVFRMRKLLQSQHVTANLHNWVDLIFGVYARKEYALKADNLFLENLYIDSYLSCINDKNKEGNMYFKQFGQVPVPILSSNHHPSNYAQNFLDLLAHPSLKHTEIPLQRSDPGKLVHVCFAKRYSFLLFERELRMHLDEQYGDKEFVGVSGEFAGGSSFFWEMTDKQKKREFLIVHRKSSWELLGFEIKKSLFNRYSLEGGQVLQFKHKVELFAIYDPFIICSQAKTLYIYRRVEQALEEDYSSNTHSIFISIGKNSYSLNAVSQFTQHTARISYLGATERGMLVSMDEENKLFISEMGSSSIQVFNFFSIRNTYFQQKVMEVLVQQLGYVVVRTDYNRVMLFSFLGDKIVDKLVVFKQPAPEKHQHEWISSMAFWNQDSCEILCATTHGNLWKLDPFYLRRQHTIQPTLIWLEKLPLATHTTHGKVAVNRIGRFFAVLASFEGSKLHSIKSEKWDEVKRGHLERKKAEDYW